VSQCERILAFLADGLPHRMEDIHRAVGFCRLNSRVAELRSRGYSIVCDKTGGIYVYRLAGTPDEAAQGGESLTSLPAVSSGAPADTPLCVGSGGSGAPDVHVGQLTIEAA
jgi:hypothetical protein